MLRKTQVLCQNIFTAFRRCRRRPRLRSKHWKCHYTSALRLRQTVAKFPLEITILCLLDHLDPFHLGINFWCSLRRENLDD